MTCQCCSPTVDREPPAREDAPTSAGGCGPECGCSGGTSTTTDTARHLADIRRNVSTLKPVS
jgi:hypothetical protein